MFWGCSTVSTIRSNPPGARVYVNNRYVGTSPVKVKLNDGLLDGSDYVVKLVREGYETQTVSLAKNWSAGYLALDILLLLPTLGISGYFIVLNGQVHEDSYNFTLVPNRRQRRPPAPPPPGRVPAEPSGEDGSI